MDGPDPPSGPSFKFCWLTQKEAPHPLYLESQCSLKDNLQDSWRNTTVLRPLTLPSGVNPANITFLTNVGEWSWLLMEGEMTSLPEKDPRAPK